MTNANHWQGSIKGKSNAASTYLKRYVLREDDLACQPLITLVGSTGVQLGQQETCLTAYNYVYIM